MVLACDASLFSEAAHWSVPRPQDANKNGNLWRRFCAEDRKKFFADVNFLRQLASA